MKNLVRQPLFHKFYLWFGGALIGMAALFISHEAKAWHYYHHGYYHHGYNHGWGYRHGWYGYHRVGYGGCRWVGGYRNAYGYWVPGRRLCRW